jgi:hypothetical protein
MKKLILLITVSICFAVISSLQISLAADIALNNTPVQIYFSPNGGCTDAIVDEIDNAKSEILVQAYYLLQRQLPKH